MKIKYLTWFLLFLNSVSYAQSSRTIWVCEVKKATKALPEKEFEHIVKKNMASTDSLWFVSNPAPNQKWVALSADRHSFILSLQLAYAEHRPFTLSPDMVWLLICQGFAHHVRANAEKLRPKFVNFERKQKITVRLSSFKNLPNHWDTIPVSLVKEVQKRTGNDLYQNLNANFSTSNSQSRLAFQVSFLETMHNYFDYEFIELCGIPEISLEGTPEDWREILQRVQFLRQYELDNWVDALVPVLQKLIKAAEGENDTDFWQKIYKGAKANVCGFEPLVNGWIIQFFPYIFGTDQLDSLVVNPYLGRKSEELFEQRLGIPTGYFTGSLNGFTFRLVPALSEAFDLDFRAGFVGLTQETDLTLKPQISWLISQKIPKKEPEEYKEYEDDWIDVRFEDDSILNRKFGISEEDLIEEIVKQQQPEEIKTYFDFEAIFDVVEESAKPKDGYPAFYKYIRENLKYPEEARCLDLERKVYVEFIVDKDGSITQVKAIKGISAECDQEAVKVIQKSAKWIPAKQRGRFVKQRIVMPISFKILENKK